MPIDDRTTNRSYQLPNASNTLTDDVARLRAALSAIDADIFARYTKTEVNTLINNLIQGAPGALDTLNELAAAMGNDPNFAATVTNALALKANANIVYTKAESDARYVQGQVQVEMVFVATANQSVYTLTTAVINKPSALVTVDGVVQPTSKYSLNMTGTQLTLSEGVPSGTVVRVLVLGVSSAGAPADDTVTTAKLRDGAVTADKLASSAVSTTKLVDAAVTPAKMAQPLTMATAKPSTSGTSIDFSPTDGTGIPSWAKRITVMLSGVSLATFNTELNSIAIRLGTSSGLESANYAQSSFFYGANYVTSGGFARTDCFHIGAWNTTAHAVHGSIVLTNISGNIWTAVGNFHHSFGYTVMTAGGKTLSGVLDRIRITTPGGTDAFDAGTINVLYE